MIPFDLLATCKSDVFIETGTYDGNGIRNAAKVGFKKYYTIDTDEAMSRTAKDRVKSHFDAWNKVGHYYNWRDTVFLVGKSCDLLPSIIPLVRTLKCTIVLDAHAMGDDPVIEDSFPMMKELEIISSFGFKTSPIFILDDYIHWDKWGYDVAKARDLISSVGEYEFSLHDGEFDEKNTVFLARPA